VTRQGARYGAGWWVLRWFRVGRSTDPVLLDVTLLVAFAFAIVWVGSEEMLWRACRPGLAPAGDLLSLASPRESRQREGEPDSSPGCAGTLRCSARAGCAQTRFAQTCAPLIRPVLRYSPPHDGGTGDPIPRSTRTRRGASSLISEVSWVAGCGTWSANLGLRLLVYGC